MCSNSKAASIDIAPMKQWNFLDGSSGVYKMHHARKNIACWEPISEKRKVAAFDFSAVTPKACGIFNSYDVIDRFAQRCPLNRGPRQTDERVARAFQSCIVR